MNSVVLSGRLTRDPELKHTPSGTAVCNLGLAVDRSGPKGDNGEIGAGFFTIECWDKQAELAAQYLEKGSRCAVQGELRFRTWDAQDGTKRTAVEVRAFRIEFLETKAEAEQRRGDGGGQQTTTAQEAASDFGSPADDDIPF